MEALLQETTWAGDRVDTPDALMAVGWQKGSQHMGMGTRHLPVPLAMGGGSRPRSGGTGAQQESQQCFPRKGGNRVRCLLAPTATPWGLSAAVLAPGISASGAQMGAHPAMPGHHAKPCAHQLW